MPRHFIAALLLVAGFAASARRKARSSGSGRRSTMPAGTSDGAWRTPWHAGRSPRRSRSSSTASCSGSRWDKQLAGSALQLEVPAYGAVILRGSVASKEVKARAVDLVQNTIGVTSVVDELAVMKDAKVIQARPAEPGQVITVSPPVLVPAETKVIIPPSRTVVVPPGTEVVVPKGTTVIEKR